MPWIRRTGAVTRLGDANCWRARASRSGRLTGWWAAELNAHSSAAGSTSRASRSYTARRQPATAARCGASWQSMSTPIARMCRLLLRSRDRPGHRLAVDASIDRPIASTLPLS